MTWFYLMLGSAFIVSIISILEKKVLAREHSIEYAGTLATLNLVLSIPLLFFANWNNLDIQKILFIMIACALGTTSFILVTKSIKHMEVSAVTPMLNLSTGATAIFSFIILGDRLHSLQVIGLIMLMAGSYILQSHKNDSVLDPVKTFIKSKYSHFLFVAIIIYGVTSIFDKIVLSQYQINPLTYLIVVHISQSLYLITIMNIKYDGLKGIKRGLQNMHWWVVLISLLTVVDRVLNVFAIKLTYIGLVVAMKRSSSFFTILMAGELFHEKNILRKLFASAILIAGVVLIVIK